MNNLIGQSIGRYHILEQLGEGGMAVVYKAYDTHLECEVAVKVLRTDNLAPIVFENALKRFTHESKILAKLTHPNIIKVIDFGEFQNIPYLVMTYIPGGTLKQIMGKPVPYSEAAKILIPIADALQYAHDHQAIHRDVKPSNILISESGNPLLTDFGIAKILDLEAGQTITATGVGIGTPEYMAPEQGLGHHVDNRVDIYSLGVVFYELVTGHKPYTADTPMAVILKQSTEPLIKPSYFVKNIPKLVEEVLFKALNKNPDYRYKSMLEFENALKRICNKNNNSIKIQISSSKSKNNSDITKDDSLLRGKKSHSIPLLNSSKLKSDNTFEQKERYLVNQNPPKLHNSINKHNKILSNPFVLFGGITVIIILALITIFLQSKNDRIIKVFITDTPTQTSTSTPTITNTIIPTKTNTFTPTVTKSPVPSITPTYTITATSRPRTTNTPSQPYVKITRKVQADTCHWQMTFTVYNLTPNIIIPLNATNYELDCSTNDWKTTSWTDTRYESNSTGTLIISYSNIGYGNHDWVFMDPSGITVPFSFSTP